MSATPVPGPDESVADMHAYAAADYAAQKAKEHEPRPAHSPLPASEAFTVDNTDRTGK